MVMFKEEYEFLIMWLIKSMNTQMFSNRPFVAGFIFFYYFPIGFEMVSIEYFFLSIVAIHMLRVR